MHEVVAQLGDERIDAVELALRPQEGHEAHLRLLAVQIAVEVEQGEAEYICTVELYFSTQERANDARALWKSLKGNW